jgi:hypothetical protein
MWPRSKAVSAPSDEKNSLSTVNNNPPIAGGSLRKSLDRLTQILERRVDQQVLQAQIRAYGNSQTPVEMPRYL